MYYESKNEKNKKNFLFFLFMLIIIVLLVILNWKIEYVMQQQHNNNGYDTEKLIFDKENMYLGIDDNKKIKNYEFIQKSCSAIVGISKLRQNSTSIYYNNKENLGIGSGVVITDNGYILTNQHVAGNKYSNCYITLENGETYDGDVVWANQDIDLAIIKINIYTSDYMELGDSDKINLGEDVYAIGNPIGFEFERSVTKGIISGLNRTIKIDNKDELTYMEDMIQTDCTINVGNSGGALMSEEGFLLGINTIKITDVDGMGFAVPINIVKPIIEKLVEDGKFQEAYLGIYGYDKEVIPYLNSNINLESGVYVDKIALDGPVYNSGVLVGDIITKIDEININKMSELRKYIYTKKPGDIVKLSVSRAFKTFDVEIKLGFGM